MSWKKWTMNDQNIIYLCINIYQIIYYLSLWHGCYENIHSFNFCLTTIYPLSLEEYFPLNFTDCLKNIFAQGPPEPFAV